jgi:hypothetical protein
MDRDTDKDTNTDVYTNMYTNRVSDNADARIVPELYATTSW